MADALVQMLIAHFDSVYEGPNGDYPAVLEALAGVTVEQAAWKPAPEHNSIWQIVDHIAASKVWQIDLLEKGEAASPVWTEPAGEESSWLASLAHLKAAHARLKNALGRLTQEDLLAFPVVEWKKRQLELLLSIAAHEAHHSGQIDYLKGLQAGKSE
jgi:uncharacterized damage-inducible protein DinB